MVNDFVQADSGFSLQGLCVVIYKPDPEEVIHNPLIPISY